MSNRFLPDSLSLLGYVGSTLDRVSEKRSDAAFIQTAQHEPGAGVYALSGEIVLLAQRGDKLDPLLTLAEVRGLGIPIDSALVGLAGKAARTAISLSRETAEKAKERGDFLAIDLRSIAVQGIANDHLPPLAAAKALLTWHTTHRFCAKCGAETKSMEAGWRRDCASCGAHHFPRTDPCVIMLAVENNRCLLGRQSRFPPGMWSCLAGFVEPGESFEEAAQREMFEEAGIKTGRVTYFASQPWPFPMSVMIGFHVQAQTTDLHLDRNELEGGRWVSREEVSLMLRGQHPERIFVPPPIAIAHHLIREFVERGENVFAR